RTPRPGHGHAGSSCPSAATRKPGRAAADGDRPVLRDRRLAGKTWNDDSDSTPRTATPKIVVPERELSQAEICRRNPRIMGYKIQLAVVKSNEEAREVGMYFRRRFPNMKVEIDASLRPNYKVMAGSYLTKQSAAGDLARIRQYFKSALAMQYRVFCVEAK
ncbi:MAG: SPOR domain-containing protein, partial [Flavobacteriales bacterium]|nr:SPOR domain-containing protein [Flavobacteriales bacterium]